MNDQPAQPAASWPSAPVFLKRGQEFQWPTDHRLFYLLTRKGLHKCRNHEFFRSCVPAKQGPSALAEQEPFVECSFPLIPKAQFERIVGFFDRIKQLHNSEASVLLAFDRRKEAVRLVVPRQTATVIRYSDGYQLPVGLYYYPPTDLPSHWLIFGDVHSHVDQSAYSSDTDVKDETHSAGLHLVVGKLYREPMEIHVEAVVDGERFALEFADVVEGYESRCREVPASWIQKVKVEASSGWSGKASRTWETWDSQGWSGHR